MRYLVVSTSEWTYPDVFEYATGSDRIRLDAARGGLVGVQILLKDVATCPALSLELSGAEADFFEMLPIPVETNVGFPPPSNAAASTPPDGRLHEPVPHCPERTAPYFVYDCLKPFASGCEARMDSIGVYVRVKAPETPGTYTGALCVGETRIPIETKVYDVAVPDETLQNVYWYSREKIAELHNAPMGTPAFDEMEEKYLRLMRHMRQTQLSVSNPEVKELGDNKYEFDFTETEREIDRGVRLGFQHFSLMPLAGRRSWKDSHLYTHRLDVMSYEGYCYISQFMTALHDFLARKGLLGKMRMGVSDEPNKENEVTYRALAGLMRRYCPEIKLIEALSYCNIHGSIDIYVPLNAEYQRHQKEFETFRAAGDEIWQYVCCAPRGDGFINHFLDYPLLSTRYQYWGNYWFGLTGYLHWAFFQPQPEQDLFTTSCAKHQNADSIGILPAGDTHLCYNGEGEPWASVRLEALRQSAEEYEWLRILDGRDHEKAHAVCEKVFRAFDDVEYDPNRFNEIRCELLSAVE